MALLVVEERAYDTKEMRYLGSVKKWYRFAKPLSQMIYGDKAGGREFTCKLYLSTKGRFLLIRHEINGTSFVGEIIDEEEAKLLLRKSNYRAYFKEYGEIEKG